MTYHVKKNINQQTNILTIYENIQLSTLINCSPAIVPSILLDSSIGEWFVHVFMRIQKGWQLWSIEAKDYTQAT